MLVYISLSYMLLLFSPKKVVHCSSCNKLHLAIAKLYSLWLLLNEKISEVSIGH